MPPINDLILTVFKNSLQKLYFLKAFLGKPRYNLAISLGYKGFEKLRKTKI
jgi:hypothetical protein